MTENMKKRKSKKREGIVQAALELFQRHGIRRITVEEICRSAGASKMTFYKYFPNKIAVLKTIWSDMLDEGYRKLDEYDAMDIPFREKLQKIIEYKVELMSQWSPEFMEEVIHAHPDLKDFVDEMRAANIARFMEYIKKAQGRGDIRAMRPELLLVILDKMMRDLLDNEGLRKLYSDDIEFIRELNSFLFFGILPPESRE
jgi:AcrR family transcriptional regulator